MERKCYVLHFPFHFFLYFLANTNYVLRNNFNLPSQVAIEANREAVKNYKGNRKALFHGQIAVNLVNNKGFKLINKKGRYFAKIPKGVNRSIAHWRLVNIN